MLIWNELHVNEGIQPGNHPIRLNLGGARLELHPLKAMWWEDRQMLVVSDVHVGKAGHYAKHGMGVPARAFQENCWNLSILFDRYQPETVLYLGDLFHSSKNHEWDVFHDFIANYVGLNHILVKGNHEILSDEDYQALGLTVVDAWEIDGFRFVHHPDAGVDGQYTWCGHIHPAVTLSGAASQRMTLPCFWLGEKVGVMPAFGSMTGVHRVHPKKGDRVYVTTGQAVVQV